MDTREVTNAYRITKWAEIVKLCRTSGETISAWCEKNQINEASYYYWQKKVREAASEAASTAIGLPTTSNTPFVPIELPQETLQAVPNSACNDVAVTIQLKSITMMIHNNATPAIIESVIKVMNHAR